MSRLERDIRSITGKTDDKFTFKEIMRSVCSPHVIMVFIMFFMAGTSLYGLALFLPSIVDQLGFSANKSQLLSVGPFVVGFFGAYFFMAQSITMTYALLFFPVTLISAYLSDRHESRGITVALVSVLAVGGFALYLGIDLCAWIRYFNARCYLGAEHKYTSYAALHLMVPGAYATTPVLAAWMANNSEPYYRRSTSVAIGFIAANSVCFGYSKCIIFSTHFLFFRAAFWVSGVFQPMKDQSSGKLRSWISFCKCLLRSICPFSVSYLLNSNSPWLAPFLLS